jgi:hypothetical protein
MKQVAVKEKRQDAQGSSASLVGFAHTLAAKTVSVDAPLKDPSSRGVWVRRGGGEIDQSAPVRPVERSHPS